MLTETGLQQALIQRKDESREALDTAWTTLLVRNAVIAAAKECVISGATIVSCRGTGLQEAKTFLGLTLETQTDVVFFLTEAELVEKRLCGGRHPPPARSLASRIPTETRWWKRCAGCWVN